MSTRSEAEAVRDRIAALMTDPCGLLLGVGLARVEDGYAVAVLLSEQIDGVPVSASLTGPIVAQATGTTGVRTNRKRLP